MIATLSGKINEIDTRTVVLEVAGVGYEIYINTQELASLKTGDNAKFFVHEYLRDDAHELYGFRKVGDRELFRQLISVSGVGPKLAMSILSGSSPEAVRNAIGSGDSQVLQSVPGVGARTAARLTVELKNRIVSTSAASGDTVYEAMRRLGYTSTQAREAVQSVPADIKDDTERIKHALKSMSK